MNRNARKTLVAFVVTLAVEAGAVWAYLLLHGSFLDLLRTLAVLAIIAIVLLLIIMLWHTLVIPTDSDWGE